MQAGSDLVISLNRYSSLNRQFVNDKPLTGYGLWVIGYLLHVTRYPSPITSYPLPLTHYLLPITPYPSPLTLDLCLLKSLPVNMRFQKSIVSYILGEHPQITQPYVFQPGGLGIFIGSDHFLHGCRPKILHSIFREKR